jgi:4-amino-4-deoxy-L-arabinose transferase-like glycosyltransferase
LPVVEASWRGNRAHVPPGRDAPPRDDGGGQAVATGVHSPLFYSLLAAPYALGSPGTIWERLWLMRLVSALLGAVVAACAALIVAELLPRRPLLAAAAGLLVAFQPMFSFMSGAVNNDMGVNAAAAVLLFLLVRGLVRGLTVRLALAIGAALAIAPLMKATALALYPAAAVALAVMLWRLRHGLAWLRPAAAFGATAAGLLVVWSVASGAFDRDALTTPEGGAPLAGSWSAEHPLPFLSYLWQVFLPRLPFMADNWPDTVWPAHDIWVVRGFGSFGWYAMTFADWVYAVIAAVLIGIAALALAAVLRRPAGARRLAAPIVVLALAIAGVIGGVHAYYFGPEVRSGAIPEQGRYAFPAIAAFAAVAAGSLLALPRRAIVPAAAGLVAATMWLAYAGLFTALARFYS